MKKKKKTKMTKKSSVLLVLLALGCSREEKKAKLTVTTRTTCSLRTADKRADFIIKCAEAANPKSDEEGEDLVEECRLTADHLYCDERTHDLKEGLTLLGTCEEMRTGPKGWFEACVRYGAQATGLGPVERYDFPDAGVR